MLNMIINGNLLVAWGVHVITPQHANDDFNNPQEKRDMSRSVFRAAYYFDHILSNVFSKYSTH
jgi:hypothetical protein